MIISKNETHSLEVNVRIFMILLVYFVISANAFASAGVSLLGGIGLRQADGDKNSYQSAQGIGFEVGFDYDWDQWGFSLESQYMIMRQKAMVIDYGGQRLRDDFTYHAVSLAPVVRRYIHFGQGDWLWAPFIGPQIAFSSFQNSVEFTDQSTHKSEDLENQNWGYGIKLGVLFKQQRPSSKWIENINYKIAGSFVKYRKTEGNFLQNGRISEYKGDTPDNLEDYSISLLVGISLGEKIWNRIKNVLRPK